MEDLIELLIVFFLVVLAYWRKELIIYLIASIMLVFYGIDYTDTTMIIGIMIIALGTWTFIKGVMTRF